MIVEPLEMIVTTAFPGKSLGLAHEPIAAAEARLGVALPEPLKDFYTVAGASRDLLNADYRMLPPEKLRADGDHLIFCEENQGLEDSRFRSRRSQGLPSGRTRPWTCGHKGNTKWFGESGKLSAFLLGMTAWQGRSDAARESALPVPGG